uniref:Secreted protein n=1 Tax=Populus trichocarpa TaxID=3694 RepID=A0A2K1XXF5_POPTR
MPLFSSKISSFPMFLVVKVLLLSTSGMKESSFVHIPDSRLLAWKIKLSKSSSTSLFEHMIRFPLPSISLCYYAFHAIVGNYYP